MVAGLAPTLPAWQSISATIACSVCLSFGLWAHVLVAGYAILVPASQALLPCSLYPLLQIPHQLASRALVTCT